MVAKGVLPYLRAGTDFHDMRNGLNRIPDDATSTSAAIPGRRASTKQHSVAGRRCYPLDPLKDGAVYVA
ncbi:hypothetical protein Y032_0374g211 [Ancylostoma ceylanicum]|uniref:Uncharacterized protein n=1 Tax=Ancylostoma ceylanicum TaxID=53326 RepID=A0A016RTY9_9BILA|nr:hypothetical protein Y032_0374g211 [Ancylostoma ceylanicum]